MLATIKHFAHMAGSVHTHTHTLFQNNNSYKPATTLLPAAKHSDPPNVSPSIV